MPDLEQRWYTVDKETVPPEDVDFWWAFGPVGVVRLCPRWSARNAIRSGEITHLWPVTKPLPPGMTEEDES